MFDACERRRSGTYADRHAGRERLEEMVSNPWSTHHAGLREQALEIRVIGAIEAARLGGRVEDDFVECKRIWPDKSKARQLAASCNRARGADLIWIIGFDEDTGQVHDPGDNDPAEWWAQMSSSFDEVAPDLVRHMRITVGPEEHVTGLLFDTTRIPYVVKRDATSIGEREIPIRDGTRTRSAFRHEILQLLVPALSTPPAVLLESRLTISWNAAREAREDLPSSQPVPESAHVGGTAKLYLEHLASQPVKLPVHGMRGLFRCASQHIELSGTVYVPSNRQSGTFVPFGVHVLHDGLAVYGPGTAVISLDSNAISLDLLPELEGAESATVDIRLDVTGATAPAAASGLLHREPRYAMDDNPSYRSTHFST